MPHILGERTPYANRGGQNEVPGAGTTAIPVWVYADLGGHPRRPERLPAFALPVDLRGTESDDPADEIDGERLVEFESHRPLAADVRQQLL